MNNDYEITKLLVKFGADIFTRNGTCLHLAIEQGNFELIKFIISHKVQINRTHFETVIELGFGDILVLLMNQKLNFKFTFTFQHLLQGVYA